MERKKEEHAKESDWGRGGQRMENTLLCSILKGGYSKKTWVEDLSGSGAVFVREIMNSRSEASRDKVL